MFTSVASSCVRHGSRTRKLVTDALILTGLQTLSLQRTHTLFTPAPGYVCRAPAARSVSGSSVCHRDAHLPRAASVDTDQTEDFGSLSTDISSRRLFKKSSPEFQDLKYRDDDALDEEKGKEEEEELARRRPARRNTAYWYHLQCRKLIRDNKLQEALDLFSTDMLRVERLRPEEFNYSVLIGGCGRAGDTRRAFRLYNDMKKRGLVPTDATYTALFNACAEAPSKQAGLQQALKLEQELRRKNIPLSTVTYHALLKMHALTNHLQACVHTLREMLQNGHVVTHDTFHFLLMACLKDKKTGFRLALQIWRQMLKSGIRPQSNNYNLLLRCARDCGIGDPGLASGVLLSPVLKNVRRTSTNIAVMDVDHLEKQLFLLPAAAETCPEQESNQLIPVRQTEDICPSVDTGFSSAPNVLDIFEGRTGEVVSLGTVDTPSDRLALIGGPAGFLEKMKIDGLQPDLKTLTQLVDIVDPGDASLQMLLRTAKQHRVRLDVAFFNSAIRKAAKAGNMEAAKAVLSLMPQYNVKVNIQTFGCLALGCERKEDAVELLKHMEEAGFKPNIQVFSALIGRAARRLDYVYLQTILKTMKALGVGPNEVIIKQLEFAAQYPPNYDQYKSRNNYLVHIDGFRGYYQHWLKVMPAHCPEDEQAEQQREERRPRLDDRLTQRPRPTKESGDELIQTEENQRTSARRYTSDKRTK